jgi:hypothetical protein
MLEPQTRDLLTEHLRPPDGYQLDYAVGTTFSLDLLALLTTPLSFALFDWEDESGQPTADITAIMQALRSYADRMAIFCQSGRIAVPRKDQPLFLHLERCVFQARAPRPGGLFHPKMWLLRFTAVDEPVQYRFLCMSRNLTFDRAWDVCFRSDGELTKRIRPFAGNAPLGDFVRALPGMVSGGVPDAVGAKIELLEDEVRRVQFDLPEEAKEFSFVPLGLQGKKSWPFPSDIRRMLVISPFIGGNTLQRLASVGRDNVLVSRLEALEEAGADELSGFTETAVLSEAADLEAVVTDEADDLSPHGLHAKAYVADMGNGARVWVGSANATDAAFESNVELLVELSGIKSRLGVKALLEQGSPATPGLGSLLTFVEIEDQPILNEEAKLAEAKLESARNLFAAVTLRAAVESTGDEHFTAHLLAPEPIALPPGVTARCWPIRVGEGSAAPVMGRVDATFTLSLMELTSFFAFELSVEGSSVAPVRFVMNAELSGAPDDRDEAVLREVLKDKAHVLRFLLFLLADGSAQEAAMLLLGTDGDGTPSDAVSDYRSGLPLFESLMRALVRSPKKLDDADTLIRDLLKTPEGSALIPDGCLDILAPILEARRATTR